MILSLAWQTTRACFTETTRMITLGFYAFIFAFSAYVLIFNASESAGRQIILFFCLATGFWWLFISCRTFRIGRVIKQLAMPSSGKTMLSALVLQYCLTAILPALLGTFFSIPFLATLSLLTFTAMACLLLSVLPLPLAILMAGLSAAPLGWNIGNGIAGGIKNALVMATNYDPAFISYLFFVSVLFALVIVWRYFQLRDYSNEPASWTAPMAIKRELDINWATGLAKYSDGTSYSGLSLNMEAAIAPANTLTPSQILRTSLGNPFAPLSRKAKIKKGMVYLGYCTAAALVLVIAQLSPSAAKVLAENNLPELSNILRNIGLPTIGLFGHIGTLLMLYYPLGRIQTLYTRHSGELAELALFPFVQSRETWQRIMLKTIAIKFATGLSTLWALSIIAVMSFKPTGFSAYFIISLFYLSAFAWHMAYAMRTISAQDRWVWTVSIISTVMWLIYIPHLYFTSEAGNDDTVAQAIVTWSGFFIAGLAYLYFSWKPFHQRPHVFLQN
jgi:hypothetical protein